MMIQSRSENPTLRPIGSKSATVCTDDLRGAIADHMPAMRVFAVALSRNRDLADDLVQDSVLKAWINYEKFDPDTNLRAWLFTILRNTFYSNRRKLRREVPDIDGTYAASIAIWPDHDTRLRLREVCLALDQLPADQRRALILVGILGYTYDEAAKTCGVVSGTFKSRVNRGRRNLAILSSQEDVE